MKKVIALIVAVVFVFGMTAPIFALPEPVQKVKDGVVDIVSSPLEITNHIKAEYDAATFKPFGVMGGLLKGMFYTLHKAGSGVFKIVTSPLYLIKK